MSATRAGINVGEVLKRLGIDARLQGREWHARCPNPDHNDNDPSWRIRDEPGSQKHGLFQCFPCGFSGDAEKLVMEVLRIPWREAVDWLGNEASYVERERPPAAVVEVKERHRRRPMQMPAGVEIPDSFNDWPHPMRDYISSRGIPQWQVESWRLGFAVQGRLAGRIVIPKRDSGGALAGYTARAIDKHAPKRYLEPEPWEGARHAVMFGEEGWPAYRRDVYVAEGAINALAIESAMASDVFSKDDPNYAAKMQQMGPCVAAIGGSQPHPAHIAKLCAFQRVFVVTDPDQAGDMLAAQIFAQLQRYADGEVFSPKLNTIHRVRVREGEDAASLSRKELREVLMSALKEVA